MSTISLIASSLWSDLYGRYIIDRESPYTANEKARLSARFVCCAAAARGHRVGSSAKLESRTRRLITLVLLIRCRPRIAEYQIGRPSVRAGMPRSASEPGRSGHSGWSKFLQVLGNEHWARKVLLHLFRPSRIIIVGLPCQMAQHHRLYGGARG